MQEQTDKFVIQRLERAGDVRTMKNTDGTPRTFTAYETAETAADEYRKADQRAGYCVTEVCDVCLKPAAEHDEATCDDLDVSTEAARTANTLASFAQPEFPQQDLRAVLEAIISRAPETDPTDRHYDDMEGAEAYGGDLAMWDLAQELRDVLGSDKASRLYLVKSYDAEYGDLDDVTLCTGSAQALAEIRSAFESESMAICEDDLVIDSGEVTYVRVSKKRDPHFVLMTMQPAADDYMSSEAPIDAAALESHIGQGFDALLRLITTKGECAHDWAYTGTEYGGDDERYHGEGRAYCSKCGADGDA